MRNATKMKKSIILFTLFILTISISVDAQKKKKPIKKKKTPMATWNGGNRTERFKPRDITQALAIGAGRYSYIPVNLDNAGGITIKFYAQGGSGNNVEVYILDENGLINFQNGNSTNTYYNSGRKTVDDYTTYLSPGLYYIVVSNTFSLVSSKAVTLTYTVF
jgi:hypothetical protein